MKQVPDTANITAEAMREDGTVNRGALPAIFNPEDLHALARSGAWFFSLNRYLFVGSR